MQLQKLSVEEICMKLKPVFGKRIDEIYLKYAMAESREEREEIEHILNVLYSKHLSELLGKKVLLEPPSEEDLIGEYPLAMINYADKNLYPFSLREQDWIRHVCISGMSGSGKTTLAFHIIGNFIKKEKPFLIFDWKKSFRPLMLVDGEILYFTVGNENISNFFRININRPPEGISPKEWLNVLCDLITESFFASYGVHKVLLETLDEAFKDLGVYNGSKNYPTWNEIKWRLENRLEKTKGRTATWLESALRIAHVLTFGNFGKAFNYKGKESLTIEELLDKKVIFELSSLGNIEKKFFCEFILTYIYKFKKARQTGTSQNFEHAILVDEAHNIFLKEKTHFVKESVTDMIYREMREYGTSLICLDQHISKISDTVAGNSACHVAFQQQLPQDIETVSGIMQLKEKRQYFSMLPVGTAIVKLAERYTSPFLIKVPEVGLRKREVSDTDIANKMKFIFEGRAIEQGKDKEFAQALMHPLMIEQIEKPMISNEKPELSNREILQKATEKFKEIEVAREMENKIVKKVVENEKPKEIKEKIDNSLTQAQRILYEYVQKKLVAGINLGKIEKTLEENTTKGDYKIVDVSKVINYAMTSKINNLNKTISENTNFVKQSKNETENIDGEIEQKRFLSFLQENLEHNHNTVELYKKLNLSARKGNKIKNELLSKGLIRVEEKKNSKGWKKIIKLNFS